MSGKFGGGGTKCTICAKTAFPAETVQFEKKPYHEECFRCSECNKKAAPAGMCDYEEKLVCKSCFQKGGYAQKQKNVVWTKKEGTGASAGASNKYGGGGMVCVKCAKTVYSAEAVSFEKRVYHADCLTCSIETCKKKCTPSTAALYEDVIYCTKCFADGGFARKQASTAKVNGGATSTAAPSKFGGGGTKCYVCAKTVYSAEAISYEKKTFHGDCFKCLICDKKLNSTNCQGKKDGDDLKVYCTKCWGEQGLNRAQIHKHEDTPVEAEAAPAAEEEAAPAAEEEAPAAE